MSEILQKLAKWRSVFAGWQLGTRSISDPECQAVRDHREVTILLRAEVSAVIRVLVEKGVIGREAFLAILDDEAEHLDRMYEKKFPGFTSSPLGMHIDALLAQETMKYWRK